MGLTVTCCHAAESILMWRDVKMSAVYFSASTLAYVLFGWSKFSPLALAGQGIGLLIAVAAIWSLAARFLNK